MKAIFLTIGAIAFVSTADAQINATVTDGNQSFAEGIMTGYVVQHGSVAICTEPFVIGQYISCRNSVTVGGRTWSSASGSKVWVDTSGVLGGMVVVDHSGRVVCRDPEVWNQFRGPTSYILCAE